MSWPLFLMALSLQGQLKDYVQWSLNRIPEKRERAIFSWMGGFQWTLEMGALLSGSCDVEEMKRKGVLWMEPIDRIPQTPRRGRFVRYVQIPDYVPTWSEDLRAWAKQQDDGVVGLRMRRHRRNPEIKMCEITLTKETASGEKAVVVLQTPLKGTPMSLQRLSRGPSPVLSVLRMVQIYYAFTGHLPDKLSDLEGTVLVIPPSAKKNRPLMELIQKAFQAIVSVGAPRLEPLGTWEALKTP